MSRKVTAVLAELYKAGWCGGKVLDLYSEGARVEHWPGHWISRPRVSLRSTIFWNVTPYSPLNVTRWLTFNGLYGVCPREQYSS
jgi:hypothetical protein